jgi:hypothetical protein
VDLRGVTHTIVKGKESSGLEKTNYFFHNMYTDWSRGPFALHEDCKNVK